MVTILSIVHILVSLFLICIVLLQHGKGADMGATFGGSSQTVFGSEGPLPLLNKITTSAAIIFMGTSISLAYLSAHRNTGSVMEGIKPPPIEKPQTVPTAAEPETIPLPQPDNLGEETPQTSNEFPVQTEMPAASEVPAAQAEMPAASEVPAASESPAAAQTSAANDGP